MSETARLLALQEAAAPLEPDAGARETLAGLTVGHAQAFLNALEDGPSYAAWTEATAAALAAPFPETGRDPEVVLAEFDDCALGDFLAAATNKYSGFAPAAPGAVRLENAVANWLARVIEMPEGAAGVLTSGGSMANLTAIVAAREAADPEGDGAVYLTGFAHHCIDKALRIAGRARSPRRLIPTDERHRMRVDALAEALAQDRADGIRPWLIIASAGTVDTGAVDPLREIAALAADHGAWLHVDGAYGGLFMLCAEGQAALGGIERAARPRSARRPPICRPS